MLFHCFDEIHRLPVRFWILLNAKKLIEKIDLINNLIIEIRKSKIHVGQNPAMLNAYKEIVECSKLYV